MLDWSSLFSQMKSHLSLRQGRKMVRRRREVTDPMHRNISRSFQTLMTEPERDGESGTYQESVCKNIGCGSEALRDKCDPVWVVDSCNEYRFACPSIVYKAPS